MDKKSKAPIKEYTTPRIWQIIISILAIAVVIMIFTIDAFYLGDGIRVTTGNDGYGIIHHLGAHNYCSFYDGVQHFYPIPFPTLIIFLVIALGVFFIWKNRPKISTVLTCLYAVITMVSAFSVLRKAKAVFGEPCIVLDFYFIIAVIILQLIFCIIAMKKTSAGPRVTNIRKNISSDTGSLSSADELKKYRELLDSGTISQEEFDEKKKQLLGK